MKGAGGWAVCSVSCRKQLAESISSGETQKYSHTSSFSLTWLLLRVIMVCVVLAFVAKACQGTGANETETTSTSAPASEEAEVAEESSDSEPQAATADEPKQALGDFGEPGQFESTTPQTTEPVESSEPASEENIHTIPAPESDSAYKARETAF